MPQSLLRLPAVIERTGYSRASIYAAIKGGKFPAPIKLGARAVAWPSGDIDTFVQQRIDESRKVPNA